MGERTIRRLPYWYLGREGHDSGSGPVQTSRQKDTYIFGLDEVDDLIGAIFAASDINPAFVGSSYSHTELPEWYKQHNAHIMNDLFR